MHAGEFSGRTPKPLSRREVLRLAGLAGISAGAGSLLLGSAQGGLGAGIADLFSVPSAGAAGTCPSTSRINNAYVVSGNLHVVYGVGTADVMHSSNGGATFGPTSGLPVGAFQPYSVGTNGVPGSYGIGGDQGWVWIYEAPTNTWRTARPGGTTPIIAGLAGNGAHWVAVGANGKFWFTTNHGATWSAPSNGAYLNYKSIASILTIYDLEYANGVWIGCGYDTLGVGRTFFRSTVNPTRGARNNWFSVSGGDFAEVIGTGDGNAVTVYSVAYGGNCAANINTWYGCGNFGTIWRSTDNGASWSKWADTGSEIHYGIDVNPTTGKVMTASGLGGIIEISPTMTRRYSPGVKEIYEIAYVGGTDWLASGDNGQILVSHDDGLTWTQTGYAPNYVTGFFNLIAKS